MSFDSKIGVISVFFPSEANFVDLLTSYISELALTVFFFFNSILTV